MSKPKAKLHKPAAKQFVVGDVEQGADFSLDYVNSLTYKLALWFQSDECDRAYPDPVEAAKQKVKECLLAETEAGDPWKNCPQEFPARIKAKCAYDLVNDHGIASPRLKGKDKHRAINPEASKAARKLDGENPVATEFNQGTFRAQVESDILAAFPELDNPAHRPNVRSLSGLYAQREQIDRELAMGVSAGKRDQLLKSLKLIEEMADGTMKRLGVHPDQIRKNVKDRTASSVSDLVEMLEEDTDFRQREKTWALQLALQLWWMSEHYNGNRTGRQISDFECWHMTRTRPMKFTCRHGEEYTLVEGFEPHELAAWLIKEGVLIAEPIVPALIDKEDLAGMADYFAAHTDTEVLATEAEEDDAKAA